LLVDASFRFSFNDIEVITSFIYLYLAFRAHVLVSPDYIAQMARYHDSFALARFFQVSITFDISPKIFESHDLVNAFTVYCQFVALSALPDDHE
jgi:hypothetical protein